MSCGTSGPSTRASPARTRSPPWTRRYLPCGTRCSRSIPLSFLMMIVRLPRRFSSSSSTRPSISAMTAGSLGRRASNSSVTRGRPPVMSCVPPTSRGVLASRVPAVIICPLGDLDARPLGDVVVGEDVPLAVLDEDLRVQVPLVLHDRPAGVPRRVDLDPHRLVLDDVLVADLAADLGEDRDVVRVPLAEHRAAGDRAGRPRPSSRRRRGCRTSRARGPWGRGSGSRRCATGRSAALRR